MMLGRRQNNCFFLQGAEFKLHLPEPCVLGDSNCSFTKSSMVVVLLGWLGASLKYLNKYVEWYTSKGFHVHLLVEHFVIGLKNKVRRMLV
ncbi:hypothetical protein VNO77_42473 [Canavalia gladiata]|uniref:Uncharacterized protein n=1 Tax=Canavalia gladiata TaxID=3824 RepID=A0AAN9JSC2_CANGL